jgi:hypothetical protein
MKTQKCAVEDVETLELPYIYSGLVNSAVWPFPERLNIELPYDPAIQFIQFISKRIVNMSTQNLNTKLIATLFVNKKWEQLYINH